MRRERKRVREVAGKRVSFDTPSLRLCFLFSLLFLIALCPPARAKRRAHASHSRIYSPPPPTTTASSFFVFKTKCKNNVDKKKQFFFSFSFLITHKEFFFSLSLSFTQELKSTTPSPRPLPSRKPPCLNSSSAPPKQPQSTAGPSRPRRAVKADRAPRDRARPLGRRRGQRAASARRAPSAEWGRFYHRQRIMEQEVAAKAIPRPWLPLRRRRRLRLALL